MEQGVPFLLSTQLRPAETNIGTTLWTERWTFKPFFLGCVTPDPGKFVLVFWTSGAMGSRPAPAAGSRLGSHGCVDGSSLPTGALLSSGT